MDNQDHVLLRWLGTASGWTCRFHTVAITAQEAPRFDKSTTYNIGGVDTFEGNLDELKKYLEDNKEKFNGN